MSPAPGAERLKAVLDTNIYVAAFGYPKGRSALLWNAACQGRYELLVSPAIIREMARVLRFDFAWRDDRVIATNTVLSVVTSDPDDNRILECAVDGKADIIVSNDHHLLDLKICASIPIVAGPDFRRILGLK